jgi:hypothetical protein
VRAVRVWHARARVARALPSTLASQIYRDKVDHIARSPGAAHAAPACCRRFGIRTNGEPSNGHLTYGARGDSYYEYLLKQWVQSGDTPTPSRSACTTWRSADTLNRLVRRTKRGGNLAYLVEMDRDSVVNKMDELACFFGGMLTLSGDDEDAAARQRHCAHVLVDVQYDSDWPRARDRDVWRPKSQRLSTSDDKEVVTQAPHNLSAPGDDGDAVLSVAAHTR